MLDLETLKFDPSERSSLTRWSYILDRVQHHEMPPKEELDEKERAKFLRDLERTLHEFSQIHRETKGRALTLTPTFKRVLDASQIGGDYKKGGRRAGKREAIFHHGHAISISSQNNYHGRILKPPSPKAAGIVSKSLPNHCQILQFARVPRYLDPSP